MVLDYRRSPLSCRTSILGRVNQYTYELRYHTEISHGRCWRVAILITIAFLTSPAWAQNAPELPLMPLPAKVVPGAGAVPIDVQFSAAISGAGGKDPRVQQAVRRTFERLARQTGIPIKRNMASDLANATLEVIVERRGHSGPNGWVMMNAIRLT